MAPRVTPVDVSDCDDLAAAERVYCAETGVEPIVDRASVHFFQRSGHSFAARGRAASDPAAGVRPPGGARPAGGARPPGGAEEGLLGFVLAHASWGGGRPVVRVERLVSAAGSAGEDAARALVEAVVKSSYDAGVYDIVAAVPTCDEVVISALTGSAFQESPVSVYARVLGSRGSQLVQGG